MESGHQKVDADSLLAILRRFNVDLNALMNGSTVGDPNTVETTDYVSIPRLSVSASAGPGQFVEGEEADGYLAFSRDWLQRRGLAADLLAVINVTGDSMEPRLRGGDLILVDQSQNAVRDGQLYVVRAGEDVLVKIVARAGPDQLTLVSTNPIYPPRTISQTEAAAGFNIIGRVVASMAEW